MTDALNALQDWFISHPFFGTLLVMMVIDIVLGLVLSMQQRRLSSDVSRRGMTRKVVMLMLVLVGDILSRATGIPGARETSSLFFMTSELISILENAALLGAPIPPPLQAMLIQLRQTTGTSPSFRMGDSHQEHGRILDERKHDAPPAGPDPLTDVLVTIEKGELP